MFGNANRFGTTNTQATPSFGSGFGQNQGSNQSVAFGTQANKTGFGFGNQPSAFGSINQTSAGSPFGGAISSFGTTTPSSGIGFGTANSTALGGSTPFRSSPAFGNSTSTFGNTTTAFGATVPSFGTSTTTFGNSTAAPTFGNTSTSFGNPTPAFGGSAPTFGGSAPIFGAAPSAGFGGATTAFGNPTSVGFGGNSQFGNNASFGNTSTFGGNTGTFGSSATTPAFGSVTAPTFGNTSTGFGSTTSTFGGIGGTGSNTSNTFRTPSFGTTGTSTFGSVAPSFGGSSMTTAPIFGSATAPTFGGSNLGSTQSMFGSATTGFGAPTTSFGVPNTGFGNVGLSNQSGTSNIPFSPNMIKDTVTKGGAQSTTTSKLQCISGMPQYESKSLEELRWEDYQKGNKTSSLGTSFGTTSAFGVTSSPFGTTNSGFGTSAFGNPTTSFGTGLNNSFTNTSFGNTTNSSIGAQSTGFNAGVSNPFGGVATNNSWSNPTATSAAKPTSFGGFGTTSPSTNTFGFTSNSSTLGTSTNLFGNSLGNSTTNAFGSSLGTTLGQPSFGQSMQQPQQSTFGNLTNTFGQQHNQQSNPFGLSNSTFGTNTFGGLGAKPEQSTFGTLGFPSATTTSSSTFGGLGSNPLSGFQNFGSNSFTPANQFGLGSSSLVPTNNFGSNLMPGFNTSAFGNTATSTSSGFGSISNLSNNNNQIQISSNLNNQNTYIPQQIDVAQKIEFLKKKRDEIDLQFKNLTEKKAVDMPSVIFPPSHIISKPLVARSPNSIVKIRPRGQRRETAHANVNMRSPEKTIEIIHTKPSKRLVITELPRKIPVSDSKSYDLRMETPARPSEKSNDYLSVGDKTGLTPFTTDSPSIPYNLHSSQIQSETREIPEDTSFSNLSGPPRLDNKDYFTVPDMKVLEKMSDLELYRIKNFTVCRPNVGQVLWEGETDVRGLHLDKIVFIEYKEVRVYEDNTAEFEKPSLGKGLNKPAIITLYNVFPSNSNKKDNYIDKLKAFCEENDAEFIEYVSETGEWTFRVKHFSRYGLVDSDEDDENCEQIQNDSNNFDNGNQGKDTTMHDILQEKSKIKDLVIRSYDKEIEDIEGVDESKMSINYENTPLLRKYTEPLGFERRDSLRKPRVITPFLISSNRKRSLSNTISKHDNIVVIYQPEMIIDQIVENQLTTYSNDISVTKQMNNNADYDNGSVIKIDEIIKSTLSNIQSETVSSINSPCMTILRTLKSTFFEKKYSNDISKISTLPKQPIKDFNLAMRRSFRVSFSPNGHIALLGNAVFSNILNDVNYDKDRIVLIEKINPISIHNEISSTYKEPLSIILKQSYKDPSSNNLPLWVVPKCIPSEIHEYVPFLNIVKELKILYDNSSFRSSDWYIYKAICLINATIGQEVNSQLMQSDSHNYLIDNEDFMPFYDEMFSNSSFSQASRKKQLITNWLSNLCEFEDSERNDEDMTKDDDYLNQIFDCLLYHKISRAVEICEENNLFRLGMIVSQLDSDKTLSHLVRHQLDLWKAMDDSGILIPTKLLHIYRLIAGDLFSNDLYGDSIVLGHGWARAISAIYWYSLNIEEINDNCLGHSLLIYEMMLSTNQVDLPTAVNHNMNDGLFSLLKCLYKTNEAVTDDVELSFFINALNPLGYTIDKLDYRISYYLLIMLMSLNIVTYEKHFILISIILQSFISQLLYEGEYEYAVFIAFQIYDPVVRESTIKSLILQYGGMKDWENFLDSKDKFIVNELSLSESYINEACGYRYMNDFEYYDCIHYLMIGKQYLLCQEIICKQIYPNILLNSSYNKITNDEIITLLDSIMRLYYDNDMKNDNVDLWSNNCDILLTYLKFKSYIHDEYPNEVSQKSNEVLLKLFEDVLDTCFTLLQRLTELYKIFVESNQLNNQIIYKNWIISLYEIGSYIYKVFTKFIYEVIQNNIYIITSNSENTIESYNDIIFNFIERLSTFSKSNINVPVLSNQQITDDLNELRNYLKYKSERNIEMSKIEY